MKPADFPEFSARAAKYSVLATAFFIPLSTSLMGLFGALFVAFWLFSGKIRNLGTLLKKSPAVAVALFLTALFLLGLFYTSADLKEGVSVLKKYREVIYLPIVMSIFWGDEKMASTAAQWFFYGGTVAMAISYGMDFHLIPALHFGNALTYHITHSFFMAILSFWGVDRIVTSSGKQRVGWVLLTLLTICNIIYVGPGRTGMLTLIFLALLFLWQRLTWKQLGIGLAVFALLVTAALYTSPNFSGRLRAAYEEVVHYKHGRARTSMGMRMDWWYDSYRLILEKPWFGHGTGSFTTEHDRLIRHTKIKHTDNPHNEYLLIGVQLGVVGILTYLALFGAAWLEGCRVSRENRFLLQGVLLSMMAGCTMNSFLFDSHQGHYFAILTALLLASGSSAPHLHALSQAIERGSNRSA